MARLLLVGLSALSLNAVASAADRPVYLAGQLSDTALVRLSTAVAARPGAVFLMDSPELSVYLRHFLALYRPDKIIPVGQFADGPEGLKRRLGMATESILAWDGDPAGAIPRATGLRSRAAAVVVCPAKPREQFLRAACLAGGLGAPLWLSRNRESESKGIARLAREVGAAGHLRRRQNENSRRSASSHDQSIEQTPGPGRCLRGGLRREDAHRLGRCHQSGGPRRQGRDVRPGTVAGGSEAGRFVADAGGWQRCSRRGREGNLRQGTAWRRERDFPGQSQGHSGLEGANPIPKDKDQLIEMEPLTPTGEMPFSYAVGRLFHADRAVVPLMLARQRLAAEKTTPRKALVASNPGGGLSLLETFSRHTAQEMRNAGNEVTLLAGDGLDARKLRQAMPGKDLILWEGHHNTLIKDWGFATWDEPMTPAFVCLQSCLALEDWKVQPLMSRGAYAVVGTSTRTYSASGGAFSLAYFNGLLYGEQSLGGSLRQAKNFLLAYAKLKEKRLAGQAKRTGANYRAAWAFSLWGDPTFRLGQAEAQPAGGLTAVRHTVTGNTLVLDLPNQRLSKLKTDRYTTHVPANARLAGLVRKGAEGEGRDARPDGFRRGPPPSRPIWHYPSSAQSAALLALGVPLGCPAEDRVSAGHAARPQRG